MSGADHGGGLAPVAFATIGISTLVDHWLGTMPALITSSGAAPRAQSRRMEIGFSTVVETVTSTLAPSSEADWPKSEAEAWSGNS